MTARRHCLDRTPEALWVQVDEVGDKLVRMPNLDTVGLARLRGKVSQVERDNDAGLGYDGSGKYVSVIFWVGHCVHQLTRRIHQSVRRGPIHRVEPASDLAFRQIRAAGSVPERGCVLQYSMFKSSAWCGSASRACRRSASRCSL